MHTTCELESAQRHALKMERDVTAQRRSEFAREMWIPDMCDVSVALRSSQLHVLAGVRLPRQRLAARGSGLSPSLAILRYVGEPTATVSVLRSIVSLVLA
jgi:hypothetical protein